MKRMTVNILPDVYVYVQILDDQVSFRIGTFYSEM